MSKLLLILSFTFFSTKGVAQIQKQDLDQYLKTAKTRCVRVPPNNSFLTQKDFKWGVSLFEMKKIFNHLYSSSKRLLNHMYYDPAQDVFKIPFETQDILITENFIKNTILHVETALQKKYADYINFSDMGHNHFLIPKRYNETIKSIPLNQKHLSYEKIMAYSGTKTIYHTAEQLYMNESKKQGKITITDPYIKYRYLNRNVIGSNDLSGDLQILQVNKPMKQFNTISDVEDYIWWGAGIYLHANKQSCFPYKKEGKTYYFDISLEGLIYTGNDQS